MDIDGKIKKLHTPGMYLGILDIAVYGEEIVDINQGDKIFLFTDGLSETKNKDDQLYGEDRFVKLIENFPKASISKLKQIIIKDVRDFQGTLNQEDDLTLIILEITMK
jgi:sigma-B regulation protein RsbU (phosphoserine phosphatase)